MNHIRDCRRLSLVEQTSHTLACPRTSIPTTAAGIRRSFTADKLRSNAQSTLFRLLCYDCGFINQIPQGRRKPSRPFVASASLEPRVIGLRLQMWLALGTDCNNLLAKATAGCHACDVILCRGHLARSVIRFATCDER